MYPNGRKNLSISTLADKMDNTEKDVLRALHYWEKHNLIHLSKDESGITGIEMLNPEIPVKSDTKPVEEKTSVRTNGTEAACTDENTYTKTTEKNTIDKTNELKETTTITQNNKVVDIKTTLAQTERLAKNEEFVWTCRVIESYVNKPLKPKDVELISYLYDSLGFSSDLLLYLYEYGISHGSTNTNYMQSIALSWHDKNVKSPEDAKQVSSEYNATYTAISKVLGLERLLIPQKELVDRWLNTWDMDLAVVLEACNRTVLKTQKPTFNYVQSIIDNWHDTHVHTLQDVQKADEEYEKNKTTAKTQPKKNMTVIQKNTQSKNQFNQFMQREVSQAELDELERKLLAH